MLYRRLQMSHDCSKMCLQPVVLPPIYWSRFLHYVNEALQLLCDTLLGGGEWCRLTVVCSPYLSFKMRVSRRVPRALLVFRRTPYAHFLVGMGPNAEIFCPFVRSFVRVDLFIFCSRPFCHYLCPWNTNEYRAHRRCLESIHPHMHHMSMTRWINSTQDTVHLICFRRIMMMTTGLYRCVSIPGMHQIETLIICWTHIDHYLLPKLFYCSNNPRANTK